MCKKSCVISTLSTWINPHSFSLGAFCAARNAILVLRIKGITQTILFLLCASVTCDPVIHFTSLMCLVITGVWSSPNNSPTEMFLLFHPHVHDSAHNPLENGQNECHYAYFYASSLCTCFLYTLHSRPYWHWHAFKESALYNSFQLSRRGHQHFWSLVFKLRNLSAHATLQALKIIIVVHFVLC